MIQVSGYFYDATSQQKIGGRGNYTIACMAGYNYNIAEALVQMQLLEEFADIQDWAATQYLLNSQAGSVGLNYSATLPDIGLGPIQVPITGTYTKDSFSYDYNNILYWLKIYYEGILTRSGEAHDIRFCRSDNPDELYIEYNYQKYPNGLCLNDGNASGYINNIKTFPTQQSPHPIGYAPNAFLFLYSQYVDDVNPDSGTQFYIGCFNMDSTENISTVYKGNFESLNILTTTAPKVEGVNNPFFKVTRNLTNSRETWASFYNTESVNNCYAIPYTVEYMVSNVLTVDYGVIIISNTTIPSVFRRTVYKSSSGTTDALFIDKGEISGVNVAFTASGESKAGIISTVIDVNLYPPICNLGRAISTSSSSYIDEKFDLIINEYNIQVASLSPSSRSSVYEYLAYVIIPPIEVSPTDIPPADEPTDPSQPDIQDPYYDPTSDPQDPQYDPTKDPTSPDYDPTEPHTPWRPPSAESVPTVPPLQPPQDVIEVPPSPPAFVTNNAMFTLYNPSAGDLNSLANFLWSPQWSVDTFKKIFANPLDCILGLMVMPLLPATTSTKEMAVGNIATGVTMRYFTHQFYDFDCGTFKIEEYYMSYLDYAPYTKISIYLPYIGDQQLNTDEVMNTTVGIKYRFDLATGDCVAFISADGNVLYSFSGNCASRLPLAGNNWSGMLPALTMAAFRAGSVAAGVPALGAAAALAVTSMKQDISHTGSMSGSPGLMGIQTPYLIITRPRQALPLSQNSFTGYPSFITESLGSLSGYTEVESCHLEHIPCTGEELEEIERLLKEGVLF